MYITRLSENLLQKLTLSNKVVIVLGARQVGKTTLIKHFLKNKRSIFFNLDIEVDKDRLFSIASLPPRDVLKNIDNPNYIVIDEAQRKVETSRLVKGWYDSQLPVKIFLLGSSSLNLLNQSAESLTGRNEKLFLPPLLFKEIITAQSWHSQAFSDEQLQNDFSAQLKTLLLQSIVFGNYPETYTTANKTQFLLNLVSDYLLKDVLQLGLIKTPELIKKLLSLLAHQICSEVSVNELSTNLGIGRATIERYIELLEQTFVIFRLPAFSTNQRKEINKSQKIYFWDTGIRNALLKEFSLNPLRSDIGLLWENWVVAEFAKHNLLTGQKRNLYFWRSRANSEVDLIVKEGENLFAYEIKWTEQKLNKSAFETRYNTKVRLIVSARPLIKFT